MSSNRTEATTVLKLFTLVAVAAGLYARFKGLGYSALAVDEYFIANAVSRIAQSGLPAFDCGGYYTRGLLLQYLAAPLVMLFGHDEAMLRVPSLVCSLLSLYAVYRIGLVTAGQRAACAALILMALSLWQIEFARFARMYSPFSMLFLWTLYFCIVDILSPQNQRAKWFALACAVTSILVYAGAIFCLLVPFIASFLRGRRHSLNYWLALSVVTAGAVIFRQTDFRRLGVSDAPDALARASGLSLPIDLPELLLPTLANQPAWLAAYLVLLLASALLLRAWLRYAVLPGAWGLRPWIGAAAFPAVLFCLLNLYGVLAGYLLVLVLLALPQNGIREERPSSRLLVASGALALVLLLFWLSLAVLSDVRAPDAGLKQAVKLLLGYPDIDRKIIFEWWKVMPGQLMIMSVLLLVLLVDIGRRQWTELRPVILLLVVLITSAWLMAALTQTWLTSRYTFFLHAVLMLLCGIALARLSLRVLWQPELIGLVLPLVLFLVLSEDYGFRHMAKIDSSETTYRTVYSYAQARHFYERWDSRAAADYINDHLREDDLVVATIDPADYYLDRLDYFFMDSDHPDFDAIGACAGKRHIWSGARLLGERAELEATLLIAPGRVWVLTYASEKWNRTAAMALMKQSFGEQRVFRSPDAQVDVYLLPPRVVQAQLPASHATGI